MFKWKRRVIENRIEHRLVLEDDEDEVIGSVIATEEKDGWKVDADCEEIGYKAVEERVDKKFLKIMVSNKKKFIKEEFEKVEDNR